MIEPTFGGKVTMQQTVSGVRFTGRWDDVVDKSEEVSAVLKETADADAIDEWEAWRPRPGDRLDEEVRERTVEQARVKENTVEQEGKTAVDAAGEAVEGIGDAVEEASSGRVDTASQEGRKAVRQFGLSLDTVVRKVVRRFETLIYRHIVTRTNPYYFDSELVSARIEKRGLPMQQHKEFELAVDINDDGVQEEVSQKLTERR